MENDGLKIALLRSSGNLDGVVHKQSGINLQSRTANYFPSIWGISLNTSAGTNLFVNSGTSAATRWERRQQDAGITLEFGAASTDVGI